MPPALSATGPYASVARVMPKVESMPTAEMAMPYSPKEPLPAPPEIKKETSTEAAMMRIGAKVDSIPRERPLMTSVPEPVLAEPASRLVGL